MSESVKLQCKVSKSTKEEFDSYITKERTAGNFVSELLENYKNIYSLKTNYSENLNKVCRIKRLNFNQVIGEALVEYITKALKADKQGLTGHTKSMKADKHIAEIVEKIIDNNNKAKDSKDIIYINQTSIVNWLRNNQMPLVNFAVIKRYLRLNVDYLEEHHRKLNITPSHNRDLFINKRFKKNAQA